MIEKLFETKEERACAAWLLNKLARSGYWKRRPCQDDDLLRSARFAPGDVDVEKVLKKLVQNGVVLPEHSNKGGKRYSLNTKLKKEILDFAEQFLPS